MHDDSQDILLNLSPIEPPIGLKDAVMSEVRRLGRRRFFVRRFVAVSVDLLFLAAFVGTLATLVRSFRQSNFGSYLSLLVSDGRLVLSFWEQYLNSLFESLPVTGITLCLAAFLLLLLSLRYTSKLIYGRGGLARSF